MVASLVAYDIDQAMNKCVPIRVIVLNTGMSATRFILATKSIDWVHAICIETPSCRLAQFSHLSQAHEILSVEDDQVFMDAPALTRLATNCRAELAWLGWGFLSESPELNARLREVSVIPVGPAAAFLRALGDKDLANRLALDHEVPIPPSTRAHLDLASLMADWERTSFAGPYMLKAVLGGGGRGIRTMDSVGSQMKAALAQVQAEVAGPVFLCRKLIGCRHLEVQLIGDGEHVRALGTRDCSIQRRSQKLIEECPASDVPPNTLASMEEAAVRLAKGLGLRGVATAEFLYSGNQFYFCEVNPRLQVEHICTEVVWGVSLVPLQLRLALGESLQDLDLPIAPVGAAHCVAARVVAESPRCDFQPRTGHIRNIDTSKLPKDSWAYFSIADGEVLPVGDSQFGHVLAWGSSRKHARWVLQEAISSLRIECDFEHTMPLLREVVGSPAFAQVEHHTQFLEAWTKQHYCRTDLLVFSHICALAYRFANATIRECHDANQRVKCGLPLNMSVLRDTQRFVGACDGVRVSVEGRSLPLHDRQVDVALRVTNQVVRVRVQMLPNNSAWVKIGLTQTRVKEYNECLFGIGDRTVMVVRDRDPTAVLCPVAGRLKGFPSGREAQVTSGDAVVEMEAMKMVMHLRAAACGRFVADPDLVLGTLVTVDQRVGTIVVVGQEGRQNDEEQHPGGVMAALEQIVKSIATETMSDFDDLFATQIAAMGPTHKQPQPRELAPSQWLQLLVHTLRGTWDVVTTAQVTANAPTTGSQAWRVVCHTGDCGAEWGGEFVVVVNDVFDHGGSLTAHDAEVLRAAAEQAVDASCTLLLVHSNSGARMTSDQDLLKNCELVDGQLKAKTTGRPLTPTHIKKGFGPENLASAAIMAATVAKAQEMVPVWTIVSARSVGVGAYVSRLGNRILQRKDAPMLLTGINSLNSALGSDVYSSNDQIGGATLFASNGITHKVCDTDDDLAQTWARLWDFHARPALDPTVSVTRSTNLTCHMPGDVRSRISEITDDFIELQQGWSPSVVVGRARMNGRSCCIIAAQTIPVTTETIPDPANPKEIQQVTWTPCVLNAGASAKIAEALQAARLEAIPTLILANWRGFDGGTREMEARVLATGSDIVRELAMHDHPPVEVHVGKESVLLGGSYVVFAPDINRRRIHLSIDPSATIAILEHSGAAPLYAGRGGCKHIGEQISKLASDPTRLLDLGVIDEIRCTYTLNSPR